MLSKGIRFKWFHLTAISILYISTYPIPLPSLPDTGANGSDRTGQQNTATGSSTELRRHSVVQKEAQTETPP